MHKKTQFTQEIFFKETLSKLSTINKYQCPITQTFAYDLNRNSFYHVLER